MSNVKIYTAVSEDLSPLIQGEAFCTDLVRYSDYAALEAKCAALLDELEAKDKRIAELEAREVRLNDINDYLAEVHDKTLNRAFRLLAEGVRAGDVSAIRHAGINVAAAGKGE